MHLDYGIAPASYKCWAEQRRSDPLLIADAKMVRERLVKPISTLEMKQQRPRGLTNRGRPPLNTLNPVATLMPHVGLTRPKWLDDIVYGSVITSAGTSKGKMNVRPGVVFSALYSSSFSVEALRREGQPERTIMRIAKAARHVAHGVIEYLKRNPELHMRLKREIDMEDHLKCKP